MKRNTSFDSVGTDPVQPLAADRLAGAIGRGIGTTIAKLRVAAAVGLMCFAGCGSEELQTAYGRRLAPGASKSINGTAVFAEMFAQRGHTVLSRSALGAWLESADCIVWFPDDFAGPTPAVRQRLSEWLYFGENRLLIYVGRDFDAGSLYFEKTLPKVETKQRQQYEAIRNALVELHTMRRQAAEVGDYGWFELDDAPPNRAIGPLSGRREWIEGIDQSKLEIRLGRRLAAPVGSEVLLASDGEAVISAVSLGGSRLVLVANGSFLLNAPLVNPEHRKLASRLIDLAEPGKRRVVFLESGPGGPPLTDESESQTGRGGLGILVRPPYLWIFLSGLMLAAVFCMHYAMPFGPRRTLEDAPATDFGRHLAAVAALLKRTGNRSYAMRQLLLYRQLTGESKRGQSPAKRPSPTGSLPTSTSAAASLGPSDRPGTESRIPPAVGPHKGE